MSSSSSKTIYNIPGSGWTSPKWNWGYASGTGHDCALICRQRWSNPSQRSQLVSDLLNPATIVTQGQQNSNEDAQTIVDFEEVKLILALAWQSGRWDGSDGGVGGYGDVLQWLADAQRYEGPDDETCSMLLVSDMMIRLPLIQSSSEKKKKQGGELTLPTLESLIQECGEGNVDGLRRKCAGLVLREMGFIDKGL